MRGRGLSSVMRPRVTPPQTRPRLARREVTSAPESPHVSVSDGHLLEIHHLLLSKNLRRRENRPCCHCCGCGYKCQSRDCVERHYCALLDRVRVRSSCRDQSDSGVIHYRRYRLVRPSLGLIAPCSSRGRSTYCLALKNRLAARASAHHSNCRCPTCSSCRYHRDGKHFHLYPHKRCRPSSRRSHRRLVHDEKSFLPGLHA